MAEVDKCFVVMPFGVKPKTDGSGGTYDFDKVYRVIIQRAIRNVNMQPLRADEIEGNRIIHADMFKDLRDRPIVIVDLSLLNPNVFYELGVRHVMSSTGTVLMANIETVKRLPFDVALSRTIPYQFDGQNLDWDEVERVVPLLQAAIEEAKRGAPDSPIYAFLEQVLSSNTPSKDDGSTSSEALSVPKDLEEYQQRFAQIWLDEGEFCLQKLEELIESDGNSEFGVRAIGYYVLKAGADSTSTLKAAELLFNHEQYDLAAKLYGKAYKKAKEISQNLELKQTLNYASAISETEATLARAYEALKLVEEARSLAKTRLSELSKHNTEQTDDLQSTKRKEEELKNALLDVSFVTQEYASMLAWIWTLSHDERDLDKVIVEIREAIRWIEELRAKEIFVPQSRYALNLLRCTMFLRIAENDRERIDAEKNFQKILALKPCAEDTFTSRSYLRWYQVFVLADMGKYDDAQKRAMATITEDIKVANKDETTEVGRRQYTKLRRTIEEYSRYWHDTKSIGRVSQIINSAHFQ